jgi:putative ABC transport system permease protein
MLPRDVRFALRTLRKTPVFTGAAILTIALGIAATTGVFSVVNAAMIRALPFADPDRLMQVAERNDKLGLPYFVASTLNYLSWKSQTRTFHQLGAVGYATYTLTGRGEPEQVAGGPISPSLVPLLGVRPLVGRTFREGEDNAGSPPVVMISEALWKRRFGGERTVIDQPLMVNGTSCTLVGVMGPEMNLLTGGDLWMPMVIDQAKDNRLSHLVTVVGRLGPGVRMDAAQAEMDTISRRVVEEYPEVRDWTIRLRPITDLFVSAELRTALLVLLGAVALVMVIVCGNVANLLLSRSAARQKEFAIRAAMGASRARLARQVLTEGLLLAVAGGALGLMLAAGAIELFTAMPAGQQPVAGVRIDATVALFTLATSIFAGMLFGLAPAWRGTRTDLNGVLKQGARTSRGHQHPWLQNGQAALQLALATVLVVGAGLLAQSLLRLQRVPLGFNPANTLTFRLSPPATKYSTHAKSWAFYKETLDSLARLPGVTGVAVSSGLPFGAGAYTRTPVSTPSRSVLPAGTAIATDWRVVSPGFFRTLGIPLLLGRDFSEQDTPDSLPVMVVSRALARKFWGDDDPIGKVLHLVNARGNMKADYTIVGVVGDVRNIALNDEQPTMYYSSTFRVWASMEVAVRTQLRPETILPAVRERMRAIDPEMALAAVQTLEEGISSSAAQPRFNTVLLVAFAGLALAIAAVGIYGVLAYSVSQRTHEIGVRMALGAGQAEVMRLVVVKGMAVAGAGLVTGLVASVAARRVLASLLFGLEARDPLTLAGAAVALAGVALLACVVPAWRASRVDPVVALRSE